VITQGEFLAIAEAKPEMKRAFQAAVHAIVALRYEWAKNKRGLWAAFMLKRKGVSAVFLTDRFISTFYDEGNPSEQDKDLIRGWIGDVAEFQSEISN
jgi:hypothetical protein